MKIFRFSNMGSLLMMMTIILGTSCTSKKPMVKVDTPKANPKYAFDFMDANSLSPILDMAAKEGKLVFVDIYTSWCLPCKMMDEDVFTDEYTANIINENFISYKVDAEKNNGPDLAYLFEVKQYPTLLFLDTKGRVLERGEGAHYPTQFLILAESALEKSKIME